MRLPDEVQKSVVFLGKQRSSDGKFVPFGTAFLVSVPSRVVGNFSMTYLITAKHVVNKLGSTFDIRYNSKNGSAEYLRIAEGRWYAHADNSVDAAVMPWVEPDDIDCLWIPQDLFLDNERLRGKQIGVGDEVYATGLFSPTIGIVRNAPIVRSGHLAMSPAERIPISDWATTTMLAYLIEMRSLGGLSGSPVFVQRSIKVQAAEHSGREPLGAGAIFLLGVMRGHWDVQHLEVDYASPPFTSAELLNVGVALVTPAEKIIEIFSMPDLIEHERVVSQSKREYLDGGSPISVIEGKERALRIAVSAGPQSVMDTSPLNEARDI